MSEIVSPRLVMFAGPNGSGKSTITPIFQAEPDFPGNYINPDEIANELGGNIMQRAYEASAIAANRRQECIEKTESFAFETVMSHPSKLALLERAKNAGFEITLVFISTIHPKYNVGRVRQRVVEGGHDVPTDKIVARYYRSHSFLPKAAEIAQRTYIFDNTITPQLGPVIAEGEIKQQNVDSVQWIQDTLNTLRNRFDERSLLISELGQKNLSPTNINEAKYTGKIQSIGEYYAVQEISQTEVILHDQCLINVELSLFETVTIIYREGVISIEYLE